MASQHADEARPNQITDLADLAGPTAEAVSTAIEDGEYETSETDDALLKGLFGLQYVDDDGEVYHVTDTMPEYVVSSQDVPESEVDHDRTISAMDETIRAVGPDNREIVSAVSAVLEPDPGEYRATVLDEHLEAFLDEYDYVASPGDGEVGPEPERYVKLELGHEDPGAPYTVSATEVIDEQRYGHPVVDVETYPDSVVDTLHAAAQRRPLRTADRPDGIDTVLEDDAYVRVDGEVYDPALETVDHDSVPIELEIIDVDPDDRSFTLELSAGDEPAVLFSGPPEPFGVLGAYPEVDGETDPSQGRANLWSDSYEADGHVHVGERDDNPTISVNDIGITTSLEPGESKLESYEVNEKWGFEAGHYRLEDRLSVEWGGDGPNDNTDSSSYPFVVALSVPEFES